MIKVKYSHGIYLHELIVAIRFVYYCNFSLKFEHILLIQWAVLLVLFFSKSLYNYLQCPHYSRVRTWRGGSRAAHRPPKPTVLHRSSCNREITIITVRIVFRRFDS